MNILRGIKTKREGERICGYYNAMQLRGKHIKREKGKSEKEGQDGIKIEKKIFRDEMRRKRKSSMSEEMQKNTD